MEVELDQVLGKKGGNAEVSHLGLRGQIYTKTRFLGVKQVFQKVKKGSKRGIFADFYVFKVLTFENWPFESLDFALPPPKQQFA